MAGSSLLVAANGNVIIESAGETRVKATMAGDENYNEISAELIITVGKRDLSVVSINVPSGTYTYSGLAHTPSPNVADGVSPNLITNSDYTYSHGANISAGTDAGSITVTATAGGNYTGTRTVYFDIEKAPLTVTAHDDEIEFNDPPPQFTYTITGFANGEDEVSALITGEPSLTSDYTQGMPAGDYTITAAIGSLTAPNYDFTTFINGTLSVGLTAQDALSITDIPSPVTYGDAGFTLGTSGGSGTGAVTWAVTSGTAVSINTASGSVTVLEAGTAVIRATKAGDNEFRYTYAETTLTVEAKSISGLSIIVNSLQYNSTPLSPTVTINGLVQGTDFSYSFTPQTNADSYSFDITGTGNYTGTVNEEFIITPAPLTITANNRTITYGDHLPGDFAVSYDGLAGSDTSSVLGGTLSFSTIYNQWANAGSYSITPAGLTSSNYNITFADGTLTVDPLNIAGATMSFSGTFTYNGAAHEPIPTVQQGAIHVPNASFSAVYSNNTNAGTATVNITGTGNFTGAASGTFTIAQVTPTVAANPTASAIIQGSQLSASALSGGVVNGISGENNLEGTWAWQAPDTTVNASGNFIAVFTPASSNYNTITASINVALSIVTVSGFSTGEPTRGYADLSAAFTAIGTTAGTYTVTLYADQTLATTQIAAGQNITLVGNGAERIITSANSTAIFNVEGNHISSLTLGNNITLQGASTGSQVWLVGVFEDGTFNMESGSRITGFTNQDVSRAAVLVASGTFNMRGGSIENTTGNDVRVNFHGSISLSGTVSVDTLMLEAFATNATINIADGWGGSIGELNLVGAVNFWNNAQLLTGTVNATTIGQITLGNFTSTGAPIADTHIIGNDGRLILIPGSGTLTDPWLIRTAEDLHAMGRGANHKGNGAWGLNHHYRLENNITLDENNNNNWTPIGAFNQTVSNNNGFLGTFDGQNHTISGLRINYTTSGGNADLGFFASVSENGVVKNVHFTNAIVISNTNATGSTGGVVANIRMNALVQNVSFTGTVTSNRYRTGGIVGTLDNGTIENSIFNGTVTGGGPGWDNASFTGGIAGQMQANGGTIQNCFSTGNVTSTAGRGVGGILGNAEGSGTIENNYSTSMVSGAIDVGGIVGRAGAVTAVRNNVALNTSVTRTAAYAGRIVGTDTGTLNNNYAFADMDGSTSQFTSKGHDFKDGEDITSANYATLWTDLGFTDPWWVGRLPDLPQFLPPAGDGTPGDPFQIRTAEDLLAMGRGVIRHGNTWGLDSHYKLMNNINLAPLGQSHWTPIGGATLSDAFTGRFDGSGYTINGLDARGDHAGGVFGIFASAGNGAVIENINFKDANVISTGTAVVGGLVGNAGVTPDSTGITIRNVSFQGRVETGGISAGGIVSGVIGSNVIIERCSFNGYISSGQGAISGYTGGIVGHLSESFGALIQDNFSIGTITNNSASDGNLNGTGGIVGHIEDGGTGPMVTNALITRNYSTMTFEGFFGHIGGIVGESRKVENVVTISHNVALNPSIDGTPYVGRIIGRSAGVTLDRNEALLSMTINGTVLDISSGGHDTIHGRSESNFGNEALIGMIWANPVGLNWDFTTIWEWDAVNLRPKLRGQPQW
jgi:hypothetical protein